MREITQQYIDHVRKLRQDLDVWEQQIRKLLQAGVFLTTEMGEGENHSEAKANVMLAYRHMQDANSRLALSAESMGAEENPAYIASV